eukprot:2848179-Rhodomonas_salina.2
MVLCAYGMCNTELEYGAVSAHALYGIELGDVDEGDGHHGEINDIKPLHLFAPPARSGDGHLGNERDVVGCDEKESFHLAPGAVSVPWRAYGVRRGIGSTTRDLSTAA